MESVLLCLANSSGAERLGEGMRCQLASNQLPTEVKLEFAVGSRVYKVVRRPKQELKRKRGTGTAISDATGELFEHSVLLGDPEWVDALGSQDQWRPLSSGALKTSEKLTSIIGMDDEQFRQIVILPQGQFRKFLAAGSSERERILEILFRTRRFRDATELLAESAKRLEDDFSQKQQFFQAQLASTEANSLTEAMQKQVVLEIEKRAIAEADFELNARYLEARQQLQQAQRFALLQRELISQKRDLEHLLACETEIALSRSRLAADLKAQPVLVSHEKRQNILQAQERLVRSAKETESQKEKIRLEAEAAAQELSGLNSQEAAMNEAQNELQLLREYHKTAEKIAQLGVERSELSNKLKALSERSQTQALKQAECDLKLERVLAEIANLASAESALPIINLNLETLTHQTEQLAICISQALEIEKLERHKKCLEDEEVIKEGACASARETLLRAKQSYHLSILAQLARELKQGAPCDVCGSMNHPRPAQVTGELVTSSDVEDLESKVNQLNKSYQQITSDIALTEAQIFSQRKQILARLEESRCSRLSAPDQATQSESAPLDISPSSLRAKLSSAETERDRFKEKKRNFERLLANRPSLIAHHENQQNLFISLKQHEEQHSREHDKLLSDERFLLATTQQLTHTLPTHLREPGSIVHRGVELRSLTDSYKSQLTSCRLRSERLAHELTRLAAHLQILYPQQEQVLNELRAATHDFEQMLEKSGLLSIENARSQLLGEEQRSRLEKASARF